VKKKRRTHEATTTTLEEGSRMNKVIFDISMSLDGFMTAAGQTRENPMGEGGLRLVQWAFEGDECDQQVIDEGVAGVGAVIAGRRTYDDSVPWWGANGPTGEARVPVFVVTHSVPNGVPEEGVYTFVTDGIEQALEQAKAAAGDKYVTVMGGAEIGQQYIRAGLADELSIHLVPILLGAGTRMFEHLGDAQIELELADLTQGQLATHLRFRILGPGAGA
jgi:dihydrofolate reductase